MLRHFGEWDEAWQRAHLREEWDRRRRHVLLVAGVEAGTLDVYDEPEALVIGNVVLAPAHRGRGVGTAVLRDLLAEARLGGRVARLKVFVDNPARRLYARLGFREAERVGPQVWMWWA